MVEKSRWSWMLVGLGALVAGCSEDPVPQLPPLSVKAFAAPATGAAPLAVKFAAALTGAEGAVTYAWDFGDGSPAASDAAPAHSYATPGAFTALLTVTDSKGRSAQDGLQVSVGDGVPDVVAPLTVRAFGAPPTGVAPLAVDFAAAVSGGFGDVGFSWDFGDGGAADTTAAPSHTYADPGVYTVVVTVTDGAQTTAQDGLQVTVLAHEPVSPPSLAVKAFASPTSGIAPLAAGFVAVVTGGVGQVSLSWNFGDGSAAATTAAPSHSFADPGVYTVVLTATDEAGQTAQDGLQVTVLAHEPVAPPALAVKAFASPTSGVAPLAAGFVAVVTGGVGQVSLSWNFGDGSAAATTAAPSHTFTATGVYTVILTATDEAGQTAQDGLQVTALAHEPVAPPALVVKAFASPTSGVAPLASSFVSIVSGGVGQVDLSWDFGDGGTATTAAPSHTYAAAGVYTALLTATDEAGQTARDGLQIAVGADRAPVVAASASPTAGIAPLAVRFSAEAAGGNPPLAFSWSFDDGTADSALPSPAHTYATAGTYVATVTVTDSDGDLAQAVVQVVARADLSPAVVANALGPTSGRAPLTVQLRCLGSGGDAPLAYRWDLKTGELRDQAGVSYTWLVPGTYNATCTVTDADGDAATASVVVTATQDDPPTAGIAVSGPYVVSAGSWALRGQRVDLDGSGSFSGDMQNDVDDSVISYHWSFDRVPAGSAAAFTNAATGTPSFVPDRDGDYVLRLTVEDLAGHVGTATRTITVEWGCTFSNVGGDEQTVTVDRLFAQPLSFTLTTPHGIPAAAVGLTWSVGAGSFAQATTVTDGLGASSNVARAGTVAATSIALTAAVADSPACSYSFTADYVPAAPAQILVTPPNTVTVDEVGAGSYPSLSGVITDRYGNPVTGVDRRLVLALGAEQRNDGPRQTVPQSTFFRAVTTGTLLPPGQVGNPGNRWVMVDTVGGRFAVTLDTSSHEAEWYNVNVSLGDPGASLDVVSDWVVVHREDFEAVDPTRWQLQGDWEIGVPTYGPDAAFSGTKVLATNLDGPHASWGWNSRSAGTDIDPGFPWTADVRLSFQQWRDTTSGDGNCMGGNVSSAGGYLRDDQGRLQNAAVAPAYTERNCWGNNIYSGSSGGWVPTTYGPFTGWGYDPWMDGNMNSARFGFVFEENNNPPPRAGWYIDDLELSVRYHGDFTGKFEVGVPDSLLLVHAGYFQNPPGPMPPGVAGTTCPDSRPAGQPIWFLVVVLDQFGNMITDDNTTEFDVSLLAGAAPPAGAISWDLLDLSTVFGGGGGPPVYWGSILAVNGNVVTVRAMNGAVGLLARDTAAESLDLGLIAPAFSPLPPPVPATFLPDADDDSDGWSVGCGDCDDGDDAVYPGAPEGSSWGNCHDGADNNCDGNPDCYDRKCQDQACFGDDQCFSGSGFQLLVNRTFSEDLCWYSPDYPAMCASGPSGQDAVYQFPVPSDGSYFFDWKNQGFSGGLLVLVGTGVCQSDIQGSFCAGGGGFWLNNLTAGDVVTLVPQTDGGPCPQQFELTIRNN